MHFLSALIPVVSIFGPPFSGVIADKIGNFKVKTTYTNCQAFVSLPNYANISSQFMQTYVICQSQYDTYNNNVDLNTV